MIESKDFLIDIVDPPLAALSEAMGRDMATDEARVMMLAVALQESGLDHRRQISADGTPIDHLARGWWQFEKGGGVAGVCNHKATGATAEAVCASLVVPFRTDDIHDAIAWHDHLAAAFARLLLFTDTRPLPPLGEEEAAWEIYDSVWRPGDPHRGRWAKAYPIAVNTVLQEGPLRINARLDPAAPPRGAMVVTPTETVVAPASNPLKPDMKSAAFWVAVLFTVLPSILDLVTSAAANNPGLANMPWVGGAIYVAAQLRKIAGVIQLPGVRAPAPK